MKAPAWQDPPSPVARGFIRAAARRTAYLVLAALVVSCGENVTAPSPARAPVASAPAPDIVLMERTTDIAAHDGIPAVHRMFKETLMGQVRRSPLDQSASAVAAPAPRFDAANLPVPTISLPARYETAMCAALPSWSRRSVSALPSSDVETAGVGDAPASTLNIVRDGKTVATVERTWVRTSRSWQLERQVTSTPDGRFRDVVTYQHRAAPGQLAASVLPVRSCLGQSGAALSTSARASKSFYAPRDKAPSGFSAYFNDGDCSDDPVSSTDPCFDKRNEVYDREVDMAAAGAAVLLVCAVPEPMEPALCAGAVTVYLAAAAKVKLAKNALANCLLEHAKKPCSCVAVQSAPIEVIDGMIATVQYDPACDDVYDPAPYDPWANPAAASPGITEPGSGDAAGSGSSGCRFEDWDISYDGGETWEYFGTFYMCYNMT
jgi:hypothetical protein